MNKNYTIKTIAIPETNEKGDLTGTYTTLEVISIEKMKTFVQVGEGSYLTQEGLYFMCFEKGEGKPKKLHVISAESGGQIEILNYIRHDKTKKSRSYDRTHKRES